jgi:transcriptional regulator with XRE-family HTH domain
MANTTTIDHRTTARKPFGKKVPNPVDVHVGSRVRQARILAGISQEKLGAALGLTFQQVQKYEKGMNRIGASRLSQISLAVRQPIPWFYEGVDTSKPSSLAAPSDPCQQLGMTRRGLELARAFTAIEDADVRTKIVDMVQAVAKLGAA